MFKYSLIDIPEDFLLDASTLDKIFDGVDKAVKVPQNGTINIAFIDDSSMQELNKTYRNIDKVTDVLSFHYFENFSLLKSDEIAGEIVLSESRILPQAREHEHTKEKETYILILHGLLHILGYDHETEEEYREMWKIEEKLRENI